MFCLARKIAGPDRRGLVGEAFKENLRAIGVSGAITQFQTGAPVGRHRLLHDEYLERRTPPPCRRRRSLVLRDRAPPDELIHGTFKLHIRSPMHRYLRTPIISGLATIASAVRCVSASLQGRGRGSTTSPRYRQARRRALLPASPGATPARTRRRRPHRRRPVRPAPHSMLR